MIRLFIVLIISAFLRKFLSYKLINSEADILNEDGTWHNCYHTYANQTFGIITSPNFPQSYTDNSSCEWIIKMMEKSRIVVTVRIFKLGLGDRLEISENRHHVRNVFSREKPPEDIIYSSGNVLILRLMSAYADRRSSNMVIEAPAKRSFYATFEREGCGGTLTSSNGYITIPSYLHLSQSSHECLWEIIAPQNKVIVLSFIQFDMPPGTCLYNTLHIKDGTRTGGYMLGDFCEENPPLNDLRTATNVMYISYRTRPNSLATRTEMIPRIKMYYRRADACGGTFLTLSGSFSAPSQWFDNVYSCNWSINVPPEKQILLKFYNWKTINKASDGYEELLLTAPTREYSLWSSKDEQRPPESMIVPSNRLKIVLLSHRKRNLTERLRFLCEYQALQVPFQPCIDVGAKKLFMCEGWQYIDCSLRCNGVFDCGRGEDEENCDSTAFDNVFDVQHEVPKKSINTAMYFTYIFISACIILIVVVAILSLKCFYRERNPPSPIVPKTMSRETRGYSDMFPPPYGIRDIRDISSFSTPPPPYSFETDHHLNNYSQPSRITVSILNRDYLEMDSCDSTASTELLREIEACSNSEEQIMSQDTHFMLNENPSANTND